MPNFDMDEKSIYELLNSYFDRENWPKERRDLLYDRLCEYAPYYEDKYLLENDLKRTVRSEAKRNKNAADRRRRNFVRLLYLFEGIPIETFGYRLEELFPKNSYILSSEYEVLNVEDSRLSVADGFHQKYTGLIKKYLAKTSKKLIVHDYLGRGEINVPDPDLQKYFQANGEGFDYIEDRLEKHKEMEYIRVLGLSIQFLNTRRDRPNDFEAIAIEILKQTSMQLFAHICNCLKKFPGGRARFHVRPMLSRTYQFAILDDTYIYFESYRLDENGKAYPSFVEIQKVNESNRTLLQIYNNEIESHIQEETAYLTEKKFIEFFQKALSQYEKEYDAGLHDKHFNRLRDIINEKIKALKSAFGIEVAFFDPLRREST